MKKALSLLLAAAMLCGSAGAYHMADGAMQVAPKTVRTDLTARLTSLGIDAPKVTGDGGASFTATLPGGITFFASGTNTATSTIATRLDLADGTAALAASQDFGAVCGAILSAVAPDASPAAANAALQLEDTAPAQVGDNLRAYAAKDALFTYEVAPKSVRFTAAAYPANAKGIQLCVNDRFLALDVQPKIVDGRTLVPVRGIFEELGATVTWDDKTRTATMTKDGTVVRVTIGSPTATVNGETRPLDVPAQLSAPSGNARTLVPVRFISESLGALVGWNSSPETVIISAR